MNRRLQNEEKFKNIHIYMNRINKDFNPIHIVIKQQILIIDCGTGNQSN